MKHSSSKAWSTTNKFSGKNNKSPYPYSISPNAVASCLLKNGKFHQANKEFTRSVNRELKADWNSPLVDQDLHGDFTADELHSAISSLKPRNAPGPDNLHPEFLIHLDKKYQDWLLKLLPSCLHLKKIPKIWKLAKVVAVLKPNKRSDSPISYCPINLLYIPCKLYERLIYNCLQPIIESVLPKEQAAFIPKRCTFDQVALLTEDIEISFNKKQKAGLVLIDVSTAYDTIWHCGLTLKLLRTITNNKMVTVILSLISQRRFQVHICNKKSRCCILRNGVPLGSVLAPALFNLCTYHLPATQSKKYADDIALLHGNSDFQEVENPISNNLDSLRKYFRDWRLKLNTKENCVQCAPPC